MNGLTNEIDRAAKWLEQEARRVAYGQVGIVLILHAGRIARIEKTTVERTQAAESAIGDPRGGAV